MDMWDFIYCIMFYLFFLRGYHGIVHAFFLKHQTSLNFQTWMLLPSSQNEHPHGLKSV